MIFAELREQITQHQARLAEQLEAIDVAERAFTRLQEAFAVGAPEAVEADHEATTPAATPSPALGHPAPNGEASAPATTACAGCNRHFSPSSNRQRYCGPKCRIAHNAKRAAERKAAAAEPEPEPIERTCSYCQDGFSTTDPAQRTCSPLCRKLMSGDDYAARYDAEMHRNP